MSLASPIAPTTLDTITAATIGRESYFNLCALCRFTGYANPIAALEATGKTIAVERDGQGNVVHAYLIPASGV